MARFSAKRVLITGATSGIGLAGAQRIDREGGWVIATGRDPRRLALLRRQLSDRARVIDNDASDPLTGAALAKEIHASGGLDGLWLNAGYAAVGELSQIDAAAFDHMMATNVRGPVLQMAALAGKLNPGASVVVTASTSAYEGAAAASLYSATKGALISLTRCWASALGEKISASTPWFPVRLIPIFVILCAMRRAASLKPRWSVAWRFTVRGRRLKRLKWRCFCFPTRRHSSAEASTPLMAG